MNKLNPNAFRDNITNRFEINRIQDQKLRKTLGRNRSRLRFGESTQDRIRHRSTIDIVSGFDWFALQASQIPLLSIDEERDLLQRIFLFRQAFQRLVLKEPAVVEYLEGLLSKWDSGQIRLDFVCNFALSDHTRRNTVEPAIRKSLPVLKEIPRQIKQEKSPAAIRQLHRQTVRLIEALLIRHRTFESAPFQNPLAGKLLSIYHMYCQQMTSANLRLVIRVARQLCGNSSALNDMLQEGTRGLMHAVAKFDHRQNIRFSTYAVPWIKQAIYGNLANADRNIRVPDSFRSKGREVRNQMRKIQNVLDLSVADSGEIISRVAEKMKIEPAEVVKIARLERDTCSLDQKLNGSTENHSIGDLIISPGETNPHSIAAKRERREMTKKFMDQALNKREHDVISFRYGLTDGQDRTFADVGRILGITRERVRQIEKRALGKLGRLKGMRALNVA